VDHRAGAAGGTDLVDTLDAERVALGIVASTVITSIVGIHGEMLPDLRS
jgi:hypothetical protein